MTTCPPFMYSNTASLVCLSGGIVLTILVEKEKSKHYDLVYNSPTLNCYNPMWQRVFHWV